MSGGARAVNGTSPSTHSSSATVTNITDFVAWGEASTADFTISPGLWVLDNFGQKLIALIYNGPCFEWDGSLSNATATRATLIANAPTKSRHVIVSTPDRHLVFFGTETTVGDPTTQDDMFIRFSDQENINQTILILLLLPIPQVHKDWPMDQGSWELSKVEMLFMFGPILHYFLMQFVGAPFTFSFATSRNQLWITW